MMTRLKSTINKFALLSTLAALLALSSQTAIAAPQIGVMVGSDSGINVQLDDIKIGVGLNHYSVTVDKVINFKDTPYFYYGFGGKIADFGPHDKNVKLAGRAIFGAKTSVERFTFFIEAQPTLYLIDHVSVNLEAIAGVRFQF